MDILNRLYYTHLISRFIHGKSFRGKKYLKIFLKYWTPPIKENLIIETKHKFKLKINPLLDKGIERRLYEKGVYEEGTLWCFKKILKKGDTVFDIGANIGLTAIYAGKLVGPKGKVFAFEPMPSTFLILEENIKLNRLKNVLPENIALSNKVGKAFLYNNLNINRGAASFFSAGNKEGAEITKNTLKKFLSDRNIRNVNFLKIDVEGSELAVLLGGSDFLQKVPSPIICIEFSRKVNSNYDPNILFNFLNELGYNIFRQRDGKESTTALVNVKRLEDLPVHDNLYCFKGYHLTALPLDLFDNYRR